MKAKKAQSILRDHQYKYVELEDVDDGCVHRVEQYLIINSSKAITFAHHVTWVMKSASDISCMPVEEDPMTECPTMDLVIKESGTDVVLYDRGCKTQIGMSSGKKKSRRSFNIIEWAEEMPRSYPSAFRSTLIQGLYNARDDNIQAVGQMRKQMQNKVRNMIKDKEPVEDIVNAILDDVHKNNLGELEAVVLVWDVLMSVVDWNKKEELVADEARKHLQTYAPSLLKPITNNPLQEVCLTVSVDEFCYDNTAFRKLFGKIILLFYKMEIVSMDTVSLWKADNSLGNGNRVFIQEMRKFVQKLQ